MGSQATPLYSCALQSWSFTALSWSGRLMKGSSEIVISSWRDYISSPCIRVTGNMWSSSVVVPVVVLSMFETHILLSYLSRQHIVWLYFTLLLVLTVTQTFMVDFVAAWFSVDTTGSTMVTLPTGMGDILRDTTLEYNLPRSPKGTTSPVPSAAVCSAVAV